MGAEGCKVPLPSSPWELEFWEFHPPASSSPFPSLMREMEERRAGQVPGKIPGRGSRWGWWGQFLPGSPATFSALPPAVIPIRDICWGFPAWPVWLCINQFPSLGLSVLIC